jgi:hypothetical protein
MALTDSFAQLREASNKVGTEFVLTELDTALTFLDVAETTRSAETRERNRNHAYEAYEVVLRMQSRVIMDPDQKIEFQQKLATLRRRFKELGLKI